MITLYKRDKKGKLMEWSIAHNDISYWTQSGDVGGKLTMTAPTFVEQKNIGKANETSLQEQVEKEVAAKIKYQLEHGYSYEIPDNEKQFEVSLAGKYDDRIAKNKLDFPYIVEPKLDGIRCYISKDANGNIFMKSRAHKEFISCPHIKEDIFIQKFFEAYPDAILDGELYNHDLKEDFNKIVSLVKKTKPKFHDLEESAELVEYHCFDSYYPSEPELTYKERKERVVALASNIENFYLGCIEIVGAHYKLTNEQTFVEAYNEEEVETLIKNITSDGYEGIMLKKDVPYFFGRSNDMLKYKKFFDEEYEIVDFEEGNGNLKGIAAAVICTVKNGTLFKAGVTGTQEYAAELFANKEKYVGKLATIKYQALTPIKEGKGGVPRFGKMTAIRDYEA
jgi:DNA ligase-1